jgi:hypothetical protein
MIKKAKDAAVTTLCDGITAGMNRFNEKKYVKEQ